MGYDDYLGRAKRYGVNLSNPRRLPGGYQTGNLDDIASRYSPNPDAAMSNAGNLALARFSGYGLPPAQPGAAGPVGPPAPSSALPPATSILDTAPKAVAPAAGTQPDSGTPPPAKNARQRWMEAGGSSRTYNRANVARGVRSGIDARSNPSAKNSTASADIRAGWGWDRNGSMDLPY